MNRGVVLDTYYRDALLATCFQEGLLYDDEEKSDRVFNKLKEQTVDRTVKSILLENVMLSGRFILDTPFGEWVTAHPFVI